LSKDDIFLHDLASHLGKTLEEINEMPYSEFKSWYEYSLIKPFNTNEIMIAQLTSLLHNINSKKPISTMGFMVSISEQLKKEEAQKDMEKRLMEEL